MEDIPNPIYLNKHWRVRSDGFQWIIERHKSNSADESASWKAERFQRRRNKLIESIEDLCGEIHPDSREVLNTLPTRHP